VFVSPPGDRLMRVIRLCSYVANPSLKKISIAAALAGVLFVGTSSIPLAQQTDDVNELNKRVLELYRAGRYSDAIQIAQRVLAIREKALGRDHPDVATALNNLAELYRSQGRYVGNGATAGRARSKWDVGTASTA
jgi:tetratricopeptide (TPR) repeat protein